jgi:hypothetical protein
VTKWTCFSNMRRRRTKSALIWKTGSWICQRPAHEKVPNKEPAVVREPATPLPEVPIDETERRPSDVSIAFRDNSPPAAVPSVRREPYDRLGNTKESAEALAQAINNTSARSRFDDGVSALIRKHGTRPPYILQSAVAQPNLLARGIRPLMSGLPRRRRGRG